MKGDEPCTKDGGREPRVEDMVNTMVPETEGTAALLQKETGSPHRPHQ